jgi:SHS2 domain-containing protein
VAKSNPESRWDKARRFDSPFGAKIASVNVPYEILEHPADVGFLAYGRTLAELFENAALALCALACAPEKIEERLEHEITARTADLESLLYSWLAEILAVADAEQFVFRRAKVTALQEPGAGKQGEVRGNLYGEKFDRARHAAGTYIKAVTLHQFALERTPEGFRARVFLDL